MERQDGEILAERSEPRYRGEGKDLCFPEPTLESGRPAPALTPVANRPAPGVRAPANLHRLKAV